MLTLKSFAAVVLVAAASSTAAGCGSGDPATASETRTPASSGSGVLDVPGTLPVDSQIWIDATTTIVSDSDLAAGQLQQALAAAEPTITRGGQLTIMMFGRVGKQRHVIYEEAVPTRRDQGINYRGPADDARRDAVGASLRVALRLDAASPETRGALRQLTDGRGSDIGRAVSQAVQAAAAGSSPTKIATVITDGWHDQPELVLRSELGDSTATSTVARRLVSSSANGGKVDLLRIVGLAHTAGIPAPDAAVIDRLEAVWQQACHTLAVRRCETSAAL